LAKLEIALGRFLKTINGNKQSVTEKKGWDQSERVSSNKAHRATPQKTETLPRLPRSQDHTNRSGKAKRRKEAKIEDSSQE